ncbi:MAG: YceI family protein [Balneolaceae bacterium]|nr:YceI family protein [Balneolaceae bacterium]
MELLKRLSTPASILLTLLWLVPGVGEAQVYKTESGHAEFRSEVPLHSFTGTSDHLVGLINLADSTVDFYIDLNTLDTGINKRDRDMKETLETDKFPFAEFFGKLVSDFDTSSSEPQNVTVKGEFGIHGITRQVQIDGTLQKTDRGLIVKADWVIDIENYDIEPPGILFYRVEKEQDINIEALLTPTEQG